MTFENGGYIFGLRICLRRKGELIILNKKAILSTITFLIASSMFLSSAFAGEAYTVAVVNGKNCSSVYEINKAAEKGGEINFVDNINFQSIFKTSKQPSVITGKGKTFRCSYIIIEGDVKFENINFVCDSDFFDTGGNKFEIGENVSFNDNGKDLVYNITGGGNIVLKSGNFDRITGTSVDEIPDENFRLTVDGKDVNIENVACSLQENYTKNVYVSVKDGTLNELDTSGASDSANIDISGGKVNNIICGNNTKLKFNGYNNNITSVISEDGNVLNINVENGFVKIDSFVGKAEIEVGENAKLVIGNSIFECGKYSVGGSKVKSTIKIQDLLNNPIFSNLRKSFKRLNSVT